jgi:hypothetical protein
MHDCLKLRAVIINCNVELVLQRPNWATVQILDRITFTGFIASSTVGVSLLAFGTDLFATKNFNEWITEALCC